MYWSFSIVSSLKTFNVSAGKTLAVFELSSCIRNLSCIRVIFYLKKAKFYPVVYLLTQALLDKSSKYNSLNISSIATMYFKLAAFKLLCNQFLINLFSSPGPGRSLQVMLI